MNEEPRRRLDTSALNHAIALLSVPIDESRLNRGNYDGKAAYAVSRAAGMLPDHYEAGWAVGAISPVGEISLRTAPCLVRARLALYLRLLRRMEVWKRHRRSGLGQQCPDRWATPPSGCGRQGCDCMPPVVWHPLWLDAPPHDPSMTPTRRRNLRARSSDGSGDAT